LSADGKLAIVTTRSASGFALRVVPTRGGSGKTYGTVPGCWEDMAQVAAADSLQFVGRGRSLVYESWGFCDPPFSNLYSIGQDGTGPHRITNTQAQETQPTVSPDGGEIVYVWAQLTGLSCAGCSDGIRIASADGTELRTLTNPDNCTFDDSPMWSPDGSAILFSETTCDSGGELFTIPAGGGSVHDLGILGSEPAWGPSRIAYVGSDKSDRGLWTANPDGTDPVKVATTGSQPAWSSDGRLAYLLVQGGTTVVVGSTQTKLPFAQVVSLAWSPDGSHFVVTARKTKTATPDVFTVKTDGTDPVRLTTNYDAGGVSWR
jgi:Tol biopolymer transport system component